MSDYREAWEGAISVCRERNDEITRLRAEVADLTRANGLLHGIVSNREEEISGLRAQLVGSEQEIGVLRERGMAADAQLASARKALEVTAAMIHGEMIENAVTDMSTMMTLGDVVQSALTDEKGT